jgi:hypothetical protein
MHSVMLVVAFIGLAGEGRRLTRVLVSGARVVRGGDMVASHATRLRTAVVIRGVLVMFGRAAIAIVVVMRHSGLDGLVWQLFDILHVLPMGHQRE